MKKNDFSKFAKQKAAEFADFVTDAKEKALDFFEEKQVIFEMSSKIKAEKAALEELYCTFGKVMYFHKAAIENGNHSSIMVTNLRAEIEAKIEEIEILEEEFLDYKEAIAKVIEKEKVFCTCCGKEFLEDEEFCNKCGSKLKRD